MNLSEFRNNLAVNDSFELAVYRLNILGLDSIYSVQLLQLRLDIWKKISMYRYFISLLLHFDIVFLPENPELRHLLFQLFGCQLHLSDISCHFQLLQSVLFDIFPNRKWDFTLCCLTLAIEYYNKTILSFMKKRTVFHILIFEM